MNRLLTLCAILLFTHLNLRAQEVSKVTAENTSAFTLVIKGYDKIEGEIRIAMFNSKEKYTKDPVHAVVLPVIADSLVWAVDDLPHGEYAIAVYHDKNTNGKLDTNLLGIPKEQYGFSNDARGRFGPAKWNSAKFRFPNTLSSLTIKIH
mgnify:CR=1 FL=1